MMSVPLSQQTNTWNSNQPMWSPTIPQNTINYPANQGNFATNQLEFHSNLNSNSSQKVENTPAQDIMDLLS